MRKSKLVKQEAEKLVAKLKEIEVLAAEADMEESAKMEVARHTIDSVCEKDNIFCGVILSREDIMNIISLAIETQESVKIPFNLYFND